jgi:hypothetical protein
MQNFKIISGHIKVLYMVLDQSKIDWYDFKLGKKHFKKNPWKEWKQSKCREIMYGYYELLKDINLSPFYKIMESDINKSEEG